MPTVFFSYSHIDEGLRDQLEIQLSMLKRQGVIDTWHDRRIGAGQNIDHAIDDIIDKADVILLLVTPDFIASEYCYDREMARAMARHEAGEAIVIPVILRPCDWHPAPFGKLNATPADGKPITTWPNTDEAFLQVARAVREAAGRVAGGADTDGATPGAVTLPVTAPMSAPTSTPVGPRSSNLRLAKTFTQRDMDRFQTETFEYLARFFENSLGELSARNEGIEGVFRRMDANRFFATVYRDGKDVARATVYMGGSLWGHKGICYIDRETTESNTMSEQLSVHTDDQALFLTSMGMARMVNSRNDKLSQEGAAELFWNILIQPLQERSGSVRLV
ncbi:hypothetical protein BZG35_16980 [Brevundimonas sp. LM2]|uniref:toll/interleukin-1 receptor domain-containing protein n=1 Tax=Brevundimonas sp. LM2 TaxID=1938605 RepID=UPI000983E0FC|nr:toll/interleukin-1 receptor domain-containing protein [Brevundimonas sp. LM2]AQR63613.1 hypothetical protein BZG35_16980 [Brevundimonas sp. LM2]